ncbi:hypothetical protein M426DRAFT_10325 [Hypoxylon sp. CI-4A]|nr:hypothetical protein M426DRAFT_10325 [Hypoxylon sp. CI-4A]
MAENCILNLQTYQPAGPQTWGRWPIHHSNPEYAMVDAPDMMPYHPNPTPSTAVHRPMPPQFMVENAYTMAPMTSPHTPQYPSNNHFIFGSYTPPSPPMATSFKQYQEECPPPRTVTTDPEGVSVGYQRGPYQTHSGDQGEQHSIKSEPIKYEPQANSRRSSTSTVPPVTAKTIARNISQDKDNEVTFHTEVDTLMKAIQSKVKVEDTSDSGEAAYPSPPQLEEEDKFNLRRKSCSPEGTDAASGKDRQKRYVCDVEGCGKRCSQKTQLETHKRAHTGERPFKCTVPGCDQAFTQRGNLKTHSRRHTGEKPYRCELCGKAFAQRGNVKPHKLTHFPTRPFRCILDGCSKTFGQRGNLKHHHNSFHKDTIKVLTEKFMSDTESLSDEEMRLFKHFAELYKNSNKGIKGRGPNRKVAPRRHSPTSPALSQYSVQHPSLPQQSMYRVGPHGLSDPGSYSSQGSYLPVRNQHAYYGQYEMDQASITSSEPTTASSSPTTMYEDEYGRHIVSQRMY